jgi:hypothetical protein
MFMKVTKLSWRSNDLRIVLSVLVVSENVNVRVADIWTWGKLRTGLLVIGVEVFTAYSWVSSSGVDFSCLQPTLNLSFTLLYF